MDIDITDLKSNELIEIFTNFPKGELVIKQDRIFWNSFLVEPLQNRYSSGVGSHNSLTSSPPRRNNQGISGAFENMADTLGRMVC